MTNISFIYSNIADTDKVKEIDALSVNEMLRVSEGDMANMVNDLGGKVRWGQNDSAYNDWNAWVVGIRVHNGKVLLNIYVQGDSTDEDYEEHYSRFCNSNGYSGTSDYRGFKVRFSAYEVASTIRFFLKEYVRRMWTDRKKIDREREKKKFLGDISLIVRDCKNRLYQRVGYHNFTGNYPKYDRYCKCEDYLRGWLDGNWESLVGKDKEEIEGAIWEVLDTKWRE